MKIRNGFVSNSSSSSFVVAGISITYKKFDKFFTKIKMRKMLKEYNLEITDTDHIEDDFWDSLHNGDFGFDCYELNDKIILGYTIADVHSDWGTEESEMSLEELNNKIESTKTIIEKFIGKTVKLNIITDTRSC